MQLLYAKVYLPNVSEFVRIDTDTLLGDFIKDKKCKMISETVIEVASILID